MHLRTMHLFFFSFFFKFNKLLSPCIQRIPCQKRRSTIRHHFNGRASAIDCTCSKLVLHIPLQCLPIRRGFMVFLCTRCGGTSPTAVACMHLCQSLVSGQMQLTYITTNNRQCPNLILARSCDQSHQEKGFCPSIVTMA